MNPETKTAIENAIRCYHALHGFPPSVIMISEDEHKDLKRYDSVGICGKDAKGKTVYFPPAAIYRWNLPGVTATSQNQVLAMRCASSLYSDLKVIP